MFSSGLKNKIMAGKKAAIVIAFSDFRDEEYFVPKEMLEKAGIKITTVSNRIGKALGVRGGDAKVDLLLEDLNPADFDVIIFIGGSGCLKNLDNENSYKIIREIVSQNKILASICISPVILAKAGVLKGKKATVWNSVLDKSAIKILKENGAIYEANPVVLDGKIITANGPAAAEEFVQAILEVLVKI